MQISSIGLNNSFKGLDSENIVDMRRDDGAYSQIPNDKYKFTQENADKLTKVAQNMDANADKVTTPLKYFTVSAIMATLAFMVGKNATSRILNYGFGSVKPIPKYINGLRNKTGDAVVKLINKTENKTLRSAYAKFVKYGRDAFDGVDANTLKTVFSGADSTLKQNVLGGINKTLALGVGTAAAALNITKRYEDKDKNGIPDRAERAMSVFKEGSEALKAIANAAGLV